MQTLNIRIRQTETREPGGMAGNVFQLGNAFMETARRDDRPFPEFFFLEREPGEQAVDTRVNLWQSYNAAAANIRNARVLTTAASNHLAEAALMLTLVQTMLDEAAESSDMDLRRELSERALSVLGNIDLSFQGLARVFERAVPQQPNSTRDAFTAQVGINENQTRQITINRINTETLGFRDASGNLALTGIIDVDRTNVARALAAVRIERVNVMNQTQGLDNDRRTLDINQRGNDAVQPGTINPPLGDDATVDEQLRRAEAERAMRMMELRREAQNMTTLFDMIEVFRR